MSTPTKSTAVTVVSSAGLPVDPALLAGFEEEAGAGFEQTTADDFAVPFVVILQKMSPEVDQDDGAFVAGAQVGQFFNKSTGELYDELTVVPCYYHRAMVEWREREDGGGFEGQHPVGYEEQFERDERGRWVTDRGTYLVDTRYMFCLAVAPDGQTEPVVLSFASTQLKKARAWLTKMQSIRLPRQDGTRFNPPIFSHLYRLTTTTESNDQGTWKGYRVETLGPIQDSALYAEARAARDMFASAADRLRPPEASGAAKERAATTDSEIPF